MKKWKILEMDPYLDSYKDDINLRMDNYKKVKSQLLEGNKSLSDFANAHNYYGFHKVDKGWIYREWAPAADSVYLMGDFNDWNRRSHPLKKSENGDWEIFIKGKRSIKNKSFVKTIIVKDGIERDRIPLYVKSVVQEQFEDQTYNFKGQIWHPLREYKWTDDDFKISYDKLYIYEAHIGMAQEKEGISTYKEFEKYTLPRIKELGYNSIQIMAIMQHPYYASFGYHVGSFFAASSWFGNPDDLKSLINKAHELGIVVLMDIVHSHAAKNSNEGINEFDGTDYQFFHQGPEGNHPAWDSKLFDYGKKEVLHFLLSNVKFWLQEYHFDGFRFDGVTSMLYKDHGLGTAFDNYNKYFSMNTDTDAVTYLQLASELAKEVKPKCILIAEDMSGMPGMCLPIKDGGLGFDYRLAMGIPDFWIKSLKMSDWDWDMYAMWYELTSSRYKEKRISYAESHDQALVGDKTIFFRLTDAEIYWHMQKSDQNIIIDRAISLHKMIRFITLALADDGYLNFMGNEFGHPEWIDFPREGNNWSYKYCQRKWSLADNKDLKYEYLNIFDKDMISFTKKSKILNEKSQQLWIEQNNKLLAFRRGDYIFIFNFHPTYSFEDFALPTHERAKYKVIFSTDDKKYGGFDRISKDVVYEAKQFENSEYRGITIYSPNRTALVLKKLK